MDAKTEKQTHEVSSKDYRLLQQLKAQNLEDIGKVKFEKLRDGEYLMRLNQLIMEGIENITDYDYPETGVRKVALVITFKPNKKRTGADLEIKITPSFPEKLVEGTAIRIQSFGSGNVTAGEDLGYPEGQQSIFPVDEG